ncbi:cytochrome oxidase I intronic ORF 5 [Tuber indicum]|nr:cytochrome oxidase I intronic ORF 5 [Tuber indicum]
MDPWFVTGLTDAEGSFTVSVLKNVNARFKITAHITDLDLMLNLKQFFCEDIGKMENFKDTCTYCVNKLKDILEIIIPHFDKYPLATQKLADYMLFKEIVSLMKNKEHLTLDGLKKIISYKASLNLVAGFTTGDGSFYLIIRANKLNEIPRTDIGFSIAQHSRDMLLLAKFITFFNCGRIKKDSRYSVHYYVVTNIKDITNKIIPFFNKYNTKAEIIKTKTHLSKEGVEHIRTIQSRMNSKRSQFNT